MKSLFVWMLGAVFAASGAGAQTGEPPLPPATAKTISGELVCSSLRDAAPCGRETFTLTRQTDGSRTLRVFSDQLQRGNQISIVVRLDPGFRPLEGFTLTYASGQFLGAGFYAVRGDTLTSTVKTPERDVTEAMKVPEKFHLLLHPAAADGLHFALYDMKLGGEQRIPRCAAGNARESVRCMIAPEVRLQYVGEETITVPAGTFATRHFKYTDNTDVWVAGEDYVVVRHEYRGYRTRFELSTLVGDIGP
ncbi:MAG: hypothetical protein SFV21_03765 [Rhodospirillaceae bacterium]|nr:hypothetical protein [Rhodospirillaceae bacterium]